MLHQVLVSHKIQIKQDMDDIYFFFFYSLVSKRILPAVQLYLVSVELKQHALLLVDNSGLHSDN